MTEPRSEAVRPDGAGPGRPAADRAEASGGDRGSDGARPGEPGDDADRRQAELDERGERPLERADRNMIEMLQELRVAQTGVQILFAFLLSMSFTERFERVDDVQRWTYVVTLLLTTLTTGLLVAPAAIHRILFGRGVKMEVVGLGQRLFVSGLVALAFTLVGAVLLVLDVAIGRDRAIPIAAVVLVVLLLLWFVLPLPVLRRAERDIARRGGGSPGPR
jgi:hypothetical protein